MESEFATELKVAFTKPKVWLTDLSLARAGGTYSSIMKLSFLIFTLAD